MLDKVRIASFSTNYEEDIISIKKNFSNSGIYPLYPECSFPVINNKYKFVSSIPLDIMILWIFIFICNIKYSISTYSNLTYLFIFYLTRSFFMSY